VGSAAPVTAENAQTNTVAKARKIAFFVFMGDSFKKSTIGRSRVARLS
jgi:hypothetical protein